MQDCFVHRRQLPAVVQSHAQKKRICNLTVTMHAWPKGLSCL